MPWKIRLPIRLLTSWMAMTTLTTSAGESRIAVAAESAQPEASVSAVAARAPYLLLFDARGEFLESHPNPVSDRPGGAGPALADWLAENQIGTLIAGDFGAKLASALEARKINRVTTSGPAGEAAKKACQ